MVARSELRMHFNFWISSMVGVVSFYLANYYRSLLHLISTLKLIKFGWSFAGSNCSHDQCMGLRKFMGEDLFLGGSYGIEACTKEGGSTWRQKGVL